MCVSLSKAPRLSAAHIHSGPLCWCRGVKKKKQKSKVGPSFSLFCSVVQNSSLVNTVLFSNTADELDVRAWMLSPRPKKEMGRHQHLSEKLRDFQFEALAAAKQRRLSAQKNDVGCCNFSVAAACSHRCSLLIGNNWKKNPVPRKWLNVPSV